MPRVKGPPNPIDVHVGARVRQRRMQIGLSQEKLGDKIGVTFQQIQKYEKGVNRIGGSRLAQIAAVMEVSPAWFFQSVIGPGHDDTIGSADMATLNAFVTSSDGLRLSRAFMRLNIGTRRALVRVVDGFAAGNYDDESPPETPATKKGPPPRTGKGRSSLGEVLVRPRAR
jgi:transcriptional regulator with XRE-family HTH domain